MAYINLHVVLISKSPKSLNLVKRIKSYRILKFQTGTGFVLFLKELVDPGHLKSRPLIGWCRFARIVVVVRQI